MASRTTTTTTVICDRCGASGERYAPGPFCVGGEKLTRDVWGRGYDGAVGGAIVSSDLCANCSHELAEWLKGKEARRG